MARSIPQDQLALWVHRELMALRGHKAQPVRLAIPDPKAPLVRWANKVQQARKVRMARLDPPALRVRLDRLVQRERKEK